MAYPTCAGCMVPQMVSDDAVSFLCFTCFSEIRFHTCPNCGLSQSVVASWAAYTCGKCDRKVDTPRRWGYADSPKSTRVEGVASPYPKL